VLEPTLQRRIPTKHSCQVKPGPGRMNHGGVRYLRANSEAVPYWRYLLE